MLILMFIFGMLFGAAGILAFCVLAGMMAEVVVKNNAGKK